MSLKSLNHILGVIEKQAKWQEQPFQQVCQLWAEVVGSAIAAQTQPLSIQRDVLRVATSSAAWAQNLTFSRQTLLHKLNQKLSTPLVDLRFSTAGWQRQPAVEKPQAKVLPSQHPSYLGKVNERREVRDVSRDANEVFNNWAKKRQMRSHSLPLCPQCECPTPPGELQLWGVCGFCSVKQLTKS
jgi:predicted nucleic acid-binding Zn ribbon protein